MKAGAGSSRTVVECVVGVRLRYAETVALGAGGTLQNVGQLPTGTRVAPALRRFRHVPTTNPNTAGRPDSP